MSWKLIQLITTSRKSWLETNATRYRIEPTRDFYFFPVTKCGEGTLEKDITQESKHLFLFTRSRDRYVLCVSNFSSRERAKTSYVILLRLAFLAGVNRTVHLRTL